MSFTQPICEACWDEREGGREPSRLLEPEGERCAFCGRHTEDGIYTRVDPDTVPFPSEAS